MIHGQLIGQCIGLLAQGAIIEIVGGLRACLPTMPAQSSLDSLHISGCRVALLWFAMLALPLYVRRVFSADRRAVSLLAELLAHCCNLP